MGYTLRERGGRMAKLSNITIASLLPHPSSLHPPLQGTSLGTDCSSMEGLKIPTNQQYS